MMQAFIVGDDQAIEFAKKKGFVIFSLNKNKDVILFSDKKEEEIKTIIIKDEIDRIKTAILSSDIVILGKEAKYKNLIREIAKIYIKPIVDCEKENVEGSKAIDKAIEKLVRYNLFGKKE